MPRTVGIGIQSFDKIREENYFYIDKTLFIKEWWESGDDVTLINRPRRFGKTLNMSMVEQFFSVNYAGREDLFEGLAIWEEEKYRQMQGTYPVISLSFAMVKEPDFESTRIRINQLIANLYDKNRFLLDGDLLSEHEKEFYRSVNCHMEPVVATIAIHRMSDFLSRYYGKKVIILLDEYDTPMQEAYVHGFWEELVEFLEANQEPLYDLALTNHEVKRMFLIMVRRWFSRAAEDYNDFVTALLAGNLMEMNAYMNRVTNEVFSYFDTGRSSSDVQSERFYHGFVLGLLVELSGRYIITSNRESGLGRYDVMLEPVNKADVALILEFKVHHPEYESDLKETVARALQQIEERQYEASLLARGIPENNIRKYGFAFEGKKVLIG